MTIADVEAISHGRRVVDRLDEEKHIQNNKLQDGDCMAKIFPSFEVINKSKQKVTEGELFLLQELSHLLDDEVEIYFQPFFNGERPDLVLIHKVKGIIIIEVKDWYLSKYNLDDKNKWHVKYNGHKIRSPFSQVFGYKNNMFNLHINGLLEKAFKNNNFYKVISCFVYFHHENKASIDQFYAPHILNLNQQLNLLNNKHNELKFNRYERKRIYLKSKLRKFQRDLYRHSVTKDQLKKIKFPFTEKTNLYTTYIYESFLRYLQPPYHYLNDGKKIDYTKAQARLTVSEKGKREKIKGVAGSGKTTVLAKRAVNAHKRHGKHVLILTFNLTLNMYIKERINEVRSEFSWNAFAIINYHKFISTALTRSGVEIDIPEDIKRDKQKVSDHLDLKYYSNENVFDNVEINEKFETILIDEVQDYKPEWIKIIRKYFLTKDGEMVLFGDEKQNIYERETDTEKSTKTVQGFGRWKILPKSFRYKEDSHILDLARGFQEAFFKDKYELDFREQAQLSLSGVGINQCVIHNIGDFHSIISYVFSIAKTENIHPNDIIILSSSISQMREIDFQIRKNKSFNERTLTTFESKEAFNKFCKSSPNEIENIRANKKYGFNLNSGVLKLSTIHSFKGYELPTVFLIVNESDMAELIYVGLTRAMFNLVVFITKSSKFLSFFQNRLDTVDLTITK